MAGFNPSQYTKVAGQQIQDIQNSPDIKGYLTSALKPQDWMNSYGAQYASPNRPEWMNSGRIGKQYDLYSSLLSPSSTLTNQQLNQLLGMTIPGNGAPNKIPSAVMGSPMLNSFAQPTYQRQKMFSENLGGVGQGIFGTAARTYGDFPGFNEYTPGQGKSPKATPLDIYNIFKGQTPDQNQDWLKKYSGGLNNYNASIASSGMGGLIGSLMAGGLGFGLGVPGFGAPGMLKR